MHHNLLAVAKFLVFFLFHKDIQSKVLSHVVYWMHFSLRVLIYFRILCFWFFKNFFHHIISDQCLVTTKFANCWLCNLWCVQIVTALGHAFRCWYFIMHCICYHLIPVSCRGLLYLQCTGCHSTYLSFLPHVSSTVNGKCSSRTLNKVRFRCMMYNILIYF